MKREYIVPARICHRVLGCYLVLIYFVLVLFSEVNVRIRNPWAIGDWLINYEGGFVRRGLIGEIALLCSRIFHVSPLSVVMWAQILLYGVLFLVIWKLLRNSGWELWMIALVFSPATLAFPVLDPQGGFRKEEIYLAGLGVLLLMLKKGRYADKALAGYLSLAVVMMVLSHEALVCFLPYYAIALTISLGGRRAFRVAIVPALLAITCGYFAVRHPGNAAIAQSICNSVKSGGAGICEGAIQALAGNSELSLREVQNVIVRYHSYRLYLWVTLLALIPVVMGFVRLWKYPELRRELRIIFAGGLICIAASVPLFVYAVDWGRWIYIHVFSLFLLLLFLDKRRPLPDRSAGRLIQVSWRSVMTGVLVVAYATAWNLPRLPTFPFRDGYFGLFTLVQKGEPCQKAPDNSCP